jgi:enterochelin esterase-like enzyme
VLETGSLTGPSFADGVLYVRDLKEIAAVAIRRTARTELVARVAVPDPTDGTEFGAFVLGLEGQVDRAAAIDQFLEAHAESPFVEGDVAHFVYRGEVGDVGIVGTMTPSGSESLYRVTGTNLFYRSYRVAPASRLEYAFLVDFGEEQADARNPAVAPGSDGKRSELRVEGWRGPAFAETPLAEPRGSIETFEIDSAAMGDTREATVYLPDGYHDTDDDYPLLLVMDIAEAGKRSQLSAIMDRIGGGRIESAVVVYVPFSPGFGFYDESYGGRRDDMTRFVADEMLTEISQLYRVRDDRRQRTLFGVGWGAFSALYFGATRSDVFGEVVGLTFLTYDPINEELAEILAAHSSAPKLDIYVGWGRFDYDLDFGEHIDLPSMNREVAVMLTRAGHRVQTRVIEAGTGWGSWWAHLETAFGRYLRNR